MAITLLGTLASLLLRPLPRTPVATIVGGDVGVPGIIAPNRRKKEGGESSPLALALMEKEEERRPLPRKQKRERDPTLIGGGVSILRLLLSRKKPPFSDSLLSPNVEEDGASINSGLIPIFKKKERKKEKGSTVINLVPSPSPPVSLFGQ